MRKKTVLSKLVIFIVFIVLLGSCSVKTTQKRDKEDKKEFTMQEKDNPISDFEKLNKKSLPESEEAQSAENVAKLYFYEVAEMLRSDKIAIDLQNKVAQLNPGTGHLYGDIDFDITLSDEDVKTVISILEEGQIDKWNKSYRYGDEEMLSQMGGEGYSWILQMQYKDGTMSIKNGKGTVKKEIQPEGYETFVKELTEFMTVKSGQISE